jgi:Tfp pilus assembly protein PilZ
LESRRFTRALLGVTLFFTKRDSSEFIEAIGRDISLAGMFVETSTPADFGAEIIVHVTLPGSSLESLIAARVRWTTREGMGLQFGSLGVHETFIIADMVRRHEEDQETFVEPCTD